jgi:hypothetical protein
LNRDSTYWVSVRARINGKPGRRAVAVSRKPDNGNCLGNISDNDLKVDTILAPASGRKFTSSEITSNSLVVRIKNLDDVPATGFTVKYSINGGGFISNIVAATIPANGTYTHTFTGVDFSAAGNYNTVVVVKNNSVDANPVNDTARRTIKQLPNPALTLPYVENFDTSPQFEIVKDTSGLPGLDKWDFINSSDLGRVRSFINTGIAKSGNRALTMDALQYIPSGNTNYLIGTFNLGNFSSISPDNLGLTLQFSYKHHGQTPHPDNRVWARRSDTDPWIEVFNFDSIPLRPGEWKTISIHLSKTAAAINPTSSFQLRFGQHGSLSMGDDISNAGITIDDVILTSAPNDVEIISIDTPTIHSCGLTSSVPLTVNYKVSKPGAACIPIKYQLDNGIIVSECAPASATSYTFNSKLNLSTQGAHKLNIWFDDPTDNYKPNDSLNNIAIYSNPIISSFPYYETFENGTASWHTEGYRSSWQYGTPASLKINKAAGGTKAWKTNLRGQYNENELSYLYSPCFNISSMASPYLTFDLALDLEDCGQFICDKFWLEYSADGKTWSKVGTFGQGINWYNKPVENVWDSANYNWHTAGINLPVAINQLQLRFVLSSDAAVTREGTAIDNIQMFDRQINASNIQWKLFPNPASNITSLISNHQSGKLVIVQLFNAAGQLLLQKEFTSSGFLDNTSVNISSFPKGLYALKVDDGVNAKIFKLLKE